MLLFLVLFHIPISNRSCVDFYKGQRNSAPSNPWLPCVLVVFPTAFLVAAVGVAVGGGPAGAEEGIWMVCATCCCRPGEQSCSACRTTLDVGWGLTWKCR